LRTPDRSGAARIRVRPLKLQEQRRDVAERLGLVAGLQVIRRRRAPVVGLLGDPAEGGRLKKPLQRPGAVVRPVRSKPDPAAGLQQPREVRDQRRLDQTPLVMARLRPGIGEKDEHPIQAGVRQGGDQFPDVADVKAHIIDARRLDMAKRARRPVQEGFGAEDQRFGAPRRLRHHVLAAAKANLQPNFRCIGLQRDGIDRPRRGVEGDLRQEAPHQRRLPRLQAARTDASEGAEGTVAVGGRLAGHGGQPAYLAMSSSLIS
jgi:hypothetical protein